MGPPRRGHAHALTGTHILGDAPLQDTRTPEGPGRRPPVKTWTGIVPRRAGVNLPAIAGIAGTDAARPCPPEPHPAPPRLHALHSRHARTEGRCLLRRLTLLASGPGSNTATRIRAGQSARPGAGLPSGAPGVSGPLPAIIAATPSGAGLGRRSARWALGAAGASGGDGWPRASQVKTGDAGRVR